MKTNRDVAAIKAVMDRAANLRQSMSAPLNQLAAETLRAIIARIDIEPGQMILSLSRDGLWRSLGIANLHRDT